MTSSNIVGGEAASRIKMCHGYPKIVLITAARTGNNGGIQLARRSDPYQVFSLDLR